MQNIITKNEYVNYINSNYLLTDCQKKGILYYYNNQNKFFVKTDSNKQIITFFKEASDNNNIEELTRLDILFNHFMSNENSKKIIEYLKTKKKLNDVDIMNYILKIITSTNEQSNKFKIKNNNNNFKCDKWVYGIEYVSLIYSNLIKIYQHYTKINIKNIQYLDICCGNGKKTSIFQKSLKLSKENVHCTDIEAWGPYKTHSKIPFSFKLIVDGKLDYEDNSFDLCTCILSLHHIKDLNNFINEISRIIKPGGYFLLIEHSVLTDYDRLFINIQHLLYTVLYDNRKNFLNNIDYINCYSMYEWNYLMMKHNFILKREESLPFDCEFTFKYDNIFYAFYQKK